MFQQSRRPLFPSKNSKGLVSWWHVVLAIDFFLILVTVTGSYWGYFPAKKFIFAPFNLATEMNFAVWWSGITLACVGLLAYELYTLADQKTKYGWLVLSILLVGLSLDEVGSLHERVGEWLKILPYGVVCSLMFIYSVYILTRNPYTKKSGLLIISAFALYGGVAGQEYVEHLVNWPEWAKGIRTGVEEGTELLATFLLLCSVVPHRNLQRNSLRAIIPRPQLMPYLQQLLLIGLFLSFVSTFVFPGLLDYRGTRGQPLVGYPMLLFFVLFCKCFWMSLETTKQQWYWTSLALVFISCSATIVSNPEAKSITYFLYVSLLFIITIFLLKHKKIPIKQITLTLIIPGLVLVLPLIYNEVMETLPFGVWALLLSCYGLTLLRVIEKMVHLENPKLNLTN